MNKILELAMSDRDTAFDDAMGALTRLKTLGGVGARILARLNEHKKHHKELVDTARNYIEWENFYNAASPVLDESIRRMERLLQVEKGSINHRLWEAVHGAAYYVPQSDTQPMDEVLSENKTAPTYQTLELGENFSAPKLQADLLKIRAWLLANTGLKGSSGYTLLERQYQKLMQVQADGADRIIRRGPNGWLINFLGGDLPTRFEGFGLHSGREIGRMIRRYHSLYHAFMRTTHEKDFATFDRYWDAAMKNLGITHSADFRVRYWNKPLNYLETRPDIRAGAPSDDVALDRQIAAIRQILSTQPELATKPAAWDDLERLFRQAAKNDKIVMEIVKDMGLKVKEVRDKGALIFRDHIGGALGTMSRRLGEKIQLLVNNQMKDWDRDAIGGTANAKLTKEVVSQLYLTNRVELARALAVRFTQTVRDGFVDPMVKQTGKAMFAGPENASGVSDTAQRRNVMAANTNAAGDMIRFAEELHALEGGTPETLADYVGEVISTFQRRYDQLKGIVDTRAGTPDAAQETGRVFLDARQGEDFPAAWLDYRTYGHSDHLRYVRMMAVQAAFGDRLADYEANYNQANNELSQLADEYDEAQKLPTKAAREAALAAGGKKHARNNAHRDLGTLSSIDASFRKLILVLEGSPVEHRLFFDLLSTLTGATVQGLTTAIVDTSSISTTPWRKFGFSKEALGFIAGSWKGILMQALGTLLQAIGLQLHLNTQQQREIALLNQLGLADPDAYTQRRGLGALRENYLESQIAGRADDMSFAAIWKHSSGMVNKVKNLSASAIRKLTRAMRTLMSTGIGVAKQKDQAFATLKLAAPFTMINQWMERGVAWNWLRTAEAVATKAAEYFRVHSQDMADPAFQFDAKKLQFSRRGLLGLTLGDRPLQYLRETLASHGINIEEAGRRLARNQDAFTREQIQSIYTLAAEEVLFNANVTTRPPWAINNAIGRFIMPLVGWSVTQSGDILKGLRDPKGESSKTAFANALIAILLGVLPASIAYALLRDWYDDEILGKKSNVLSLTGWIDSNGTPLEKTQQGFLALLDNVGRVGAFGIIGDSANSFFNYLTARPFTIDSRVFAASVLINIGRLTKNLYQQEGTATWETIYRPMIGSVGGSGYLSNFDAINNLLDFDNAERRAVKRIRVTNLLMAVGREMGADVRVYRGIEAIPNPVKPWVGQMAAAAVVNDPVTFRDAYRKALLASKKRGTADPYQDVAQYYSRMHPLRRAFAKQPTDVEYQRMLRALGDDGTEVATAVRNFNAYGEQIPSKDGGDGIKPFNGIAPKEESFDFRDFRSPFGRGENPATEFRREFQMR